MLFPALLALPPKTSVLFSGLLKVLEVGQERKAVVRAVCLWVVCPRVRLSHRSQFCYSRNIFGRHCAVACYHF